MFTLVEIGHPSCGGRGWVGYGWGFSGGRFWVVLVPFSFSNRE